MKECAQYLQDKACPVKVWLGKLTAFIMTPLGRMGGKTSTQTNKYHGTVCIRTDRPEKTLMTQMRHRRTWHLIWVYTVCHSSSNFLDTTLGNELYLVKFWNKYDKELGCPNTLSKYGINVNLNKLLPKGANSPIRSNLLLEGKHIVSGKTALPARYSTTAHISMESDKSV